MTRSAVEQIVRSVMREYGIEGDVGRIALFAQEWKIEIVNVDGVKETLTVYDSSPQHVRQSVMAALHLEV
jgi:hypothetical protein